MNLNLEAIYFCTTAARRWGKGRTITEAKKNAGINRNNSQRTEYVVQAAILNNPTEDELQNIQDCIVADEFFGSPQYYQYERKDEDTEMINRLHVGWLIVETSGLPKSNSKG